MSAKVTVVLPVLNEEKNLPAALESVAWAEQVVVVDSGSSDATVEVAASAGADVVQFHYRGVGDKKKAWSLQNLAFRNDWVLFLDADERVTAQLREEIVRSLERTEFVGFYIDREFVFMGRSLRCFRPNWNLRLFRRDAVAMEDLGLARLPNTGDNEIHEHFVADRGPVGFLRSPLLHDDYRGLTPWLDRHNKYATWEAHLYRRFRREPIGVTPTRLFAINAWERKRIARRVWVRLPFRPALRFFIWYVLRRGFLDGRAGLVFCLLMAYYEFIIGLKIEELADTNA